MNTYQITISAIIGLIIISIWFTKRMYISGRYSGKQAIKVYAERLKLGSVDVAEDIEHIKKEVYRICAKPSKVFMTETKLIEAKQLLDSLGRDLESNILEAKNSFESNKKIIESSLSISGVIKNEKITELEKSLKDQIKDIDNLIIQKSSVMTDLDSALREFSINKENFKKHNLFLGYVKTVSQKIGMWTLDFCRNWTSILPLFGLLLLGWADYFLSKTFNEHGQEFNKFMANASQQADFSNRTIVFTVVIFWVLSVIGWLAFHKYNEFKKSNSLLSMICQGFAYIISFFGFTGLVVLVMDMRDPGLFDANLVNIASMLTLILLAFVTAFVMNLIKWDTIPKVFGIFFVLPFACLVFVLLLPFVVIESLSRLIASLFQRSNSVIKVLVARLSQINKEIQIKSDNKISLEETLNYQKYGDEESKVKELKRLEINHRALIENMSQNSLKKRQVLSEEIGILANNKSVGQFKSGVEFSIQKYYSQAI